MKPWVWLAPAVLRAVHDEQLAEHGGAPSVRDEGSLESAPARPHQLASYGAPDVADLAAAYAVALARNHPFVDGNKRTAFVALELFLTCNGHALAADDADCVLTIVALAAGTVDEAAVAAWVRATFNRLASPDVGQRDRALRGALTAFDPELVSPSRCLN